MYAPCAIACVWGVCGLAWDAALRGLYAVRPQPTAMHASAVLLSSFGASLISRAHFACSVVSKLSESVWFGAKAFYGATVFNANIGAWNTARMTSMSYVCAVCHRQCVRRVWLGLGCGAAWPVCRSAAADSHACFLPCFTHPSVLHSFSRVCLRA
jgi:hypothetical protein